MNIMVKPKAEKMIPDLISDSVIEQMIDRFGRDFTGIRLCLQGDKRLVSQCTRRRFKFHWEDVSFISYPLKLLMKGTGLMARGRMNALQYSVETNCLFISRKAPYLRGLTIAHISDLHIEGIPDQGRKLAQLIEPFKPDIWVITGDFKYSHKGNSRGMVRCMEQLAPKLKATYGVFGILGNHDYLQNVFELEKMNIQMLVNEHRIIDMPGGPLCIAGVDDPHFYQTDELEASLKGVDTELIPVVLLAHTADLYQEAAEKRVTLYLSGHTHGGQICLPGGLPVVRNTSSPRQFASGAWRYKELQGYTSRGIGAVGVPARFNCPPEITVHHFI